MNKPHKKLILTIQDVKFETTCSIGALIDFETNKTLFSRGQYNFIGAAYALDLIDTLSAIKAFFPDMETKLNVKLDEIDLVDMNEIKKKFSKDFFPWLKSWLELLAETEKEKPIEKQ